MRNFLASCLVSLVLSQTAAQAQSPSRITIDTAKRTAISPYIYGANFPDWKIGLPFTLARQGGNRMSAYNWETNASNAGNDWHHQNDGYVSNSDTPGIVGKEFVQSSTAHHAAAILTVPMTGYVSADKKGDGDVNQTPDYIHVRFNQSLPKKGSKAIYPPDLTDRKVYQDEFVAWMEKIKPAQSTVWYALDNEPDIWSGTHVRIVPTTPTYAEFIARSIEYASAIKAVAPKTLICGPVSYGWQGFRRFQNATDANNRDFLDVYLGAMRDAEKKQGKRLLDLMDIHWYPEATGDGVRITQDSDKPGVALARMQAPRSLWDPTYVETSWISQSLGNKPIVLLPGFHKQIAANYPGTRLAITEYNYGGGNHISGAIAQADVLGIYGRNNVFAACNWGINAKDTAEIAGFRAFLNFDGKGGRFGDQGLSVQGTTPAANSVYAALDSKNQKRMTVIAINKTDKPYPVQLTFKGFSPSQVKAYGISSTSMSSSQLVAATAKGQQVSTVLPPLSVVSMELIRR